MAVTRLTGSDGRLDITLEGITFRRTKTGADARGTERLHEVEWSSIGGAEVTRSRKGRPVVRIDVIGRLPASRHQDDPYALKIKRKASEEAHAFVERVNEEARLRRRWAVGEAEPDTAVG